MTSTSYLVGLGSNRGHGRQTTPVTMLGAALEAMRAEGLTIAAVAPILRTHALGPAGRDFANTAALIHTVLDPPALLTLLKRIEARLGRRGARRWGARPIDLDILAWQGGGWRTRTLTIPHPALGQRRFALLPAAAIAPDWRDPRTGRTLRQNAHRLVAPRPVDPPRGAA